MSELTFSATNFRVLREVRWEIPEGLSVLVGPNGSGKSTALGALAFLRDLATLGVSKAIQASNGLVGLRHFDAGDDFVRLAVSDGALSWDFAIPFDGPNVNVQIGETLRADGKAIIEFTPFSEQGTKNGEAIGNNRDAWSRARDALRQNPDGAIDAALLERVRDYAHWQTLRYDVTYLRRSGSVADSEMTLSSNGRSVWSVLRNWRDKRETKDRYDFVREAMRDAFTAQFDDLDFEYTAQQVAARIYVPGRKEAVAHHLFSDGWFTGLLHLCAIASTPPNGLVSLDEPENSLHPHAIRSLLRSIGRWADAKRLSVVLATHSPVVLNQFKDRARVFVMEHGPARCPVPLDEHPNHEWLSHFSIGDAYANEEVGAPPSGR